MGCRSIILVPLVIYLVCVFRGGGDEEGMRRGVHKLGMGERGGAHKTSDTTPVVQTKSPPGVLRTVDSLRE